MTFFSGTLLLTHRQKSDQFIIVCVITIERTMNKSATQIPFQPEEKVLSRVEYAYRKIKNNISTNVYPSGYQVLEPTLAGQLGVSRTPVREALIRLEADKLIQLIPRRGMRVLPVSETDFEELFHLVELIELDAIGNICVDPANLSYASLEEIIEKLSAAIEQDDRALWVALDDAFFSGIVELAGNNHSLEVANNIYDRLRREKYLALENIADSALVVSSRNDLVTALKRRDTDAAIDVHASACSTTRRNLKSA